MSLFLCYSVSEGERSSPEETARPLKFESRFESGNLRKAIQVHVICSISVLGSKIVGNMLNACVKKKGKRRKRVA